MKRIAPKSVHHLLWIACAVALLFAQRSDGGVNAASPAAEQVLEPREDKQSIDGAITASLVFRGHNRLFRYTSPAGWQTQLRGGKAMLVKGKLTATLVLTLTDESSTGSATSPTSAELKTFQEATSARVPGAEIISSAATVLPFTVANKTLGASTVIYGSGGQARALQHVKSWGGNWQVDLEIAGPKKEFDEACSELARSLCNLEVRTEQDERLELSKREREVLNRINTEEARNPELPKFGRYIRGRAP